MDRKSIAAMTIGTIGVLAAGTIAGIAVYNVASSSPTETRPLSAVPSTSPDSPSDPFAPAALPAVPVVEAPAPSSQAPAGAPAKQAVEASASDSISKSAATSLVLAQAPGSAIAAEGSTRKGYPAWAIQVRRSDGSLVTAYVDRSSGVIVDWTLDQKATQTTSGSGSRGDEADDMDEADEVDDPEREAEDGTSTQDSGEHDSREHASVDDDDD